MFRSSLLRTMRRASAQGLMHIRTAPAAARAFAPLAAPAVATAAAPSIGAPSRAFAATAAAPSPFETEFENIKVEKKGNVGLITLYRPKALNALCDALVSELSAAALAMDKMDDIKAIVLTGSEKAFAAGADIKEMKDQTFVRAYMTSMFDDWDQMQRVKVPIIAAVSGFALGGGCELAMSCDMIIAGDNARFGQPEIKLGTIPGAGGTQRLIRAIGKSKAMQMVLTGDMMDAAAAEKAGLVSEVVPKEQVVERALEVANTIAAYSKPITAVCKEMVNASAEVTLKQGLRLERTTFYSLFATNDQKEGMGAFAEKRAPNFTDS